MTNLYVGVLGQKGEPSLYSTHQMDERCLFNGSPGWTSRPHVNRSKYLYILIYIYIQYTTVYQAYIVHHFLKLCVLMASCLLDLLAGMVRWVGSRYLSKTWLDLDWLSRKVGTWNLPGTDVSPNRHPEVKPPRKASIVCIKKTRRAEEHCVVFPRQIGFNSPSFF